MLHLDPRHTNRSPFLIPRQPREVWSFDTGGPIVAAPVVAGGLVVVASLSGRITALSVDGRQRWSTDLGERIYSSPLVLGERLFVGIDRGKFVSLDARTGAVRFRVEVDGDADTAPVPLPGGDLAFAAGRTLHVIRPDGTVRWRHKVRRKVFSSPAVGADFLVFGDQGGTVTSLGLDGALRWAVAVGDDADAAPAIGDDGQIFVGTDAGEVLALSADNGAIRWRTSVGGHVRGPLAVARDGAVLASTYGPAPAVVCLDPERGAVRWRFGVRGTGAKEFGIHGSPVEDPTGALLFGAQDNVLYALDPGGTLRWRLPFEGDVDATVILGGGGFVFVGSDDGKLHALRDAGGP
jgi:outer membrane protein assembly factor BamB